MQDSPNKTTLHKTKLSIPTIALFIGLLILPSIALYKIQFKTNIHPIVLPITILLINIITYIVYAADKRKAQNNTWRTSETSLHFLELLTGWPAAFIAQRRLRHKSSKLPFQITFWLIVTLHQLTAYEYINNWNYTKQILQ